MPTMNDDLTRQLNTSLIRLAEQVTQLSTKMDIFHPQLSAQVAGLVDVTNRVTRLEDKIFNVVEDFKQHQDGLREKDNKREQQLRWAIGTAITMAGLVVTLALALFPHVHWN